MAEQRPPTTREHLSSVFQLWDRAQPATKGDLIDLALMLADRIDGVDAAIGVRIERSKVGEQSRVRP